MSEYTPMEPSEILEVQTPTAIPPGYAYYSTAPAPRKKKHVGLILFSAFLLLVAVLLTVFLSLYELHIDHSGDSFSLQIHRRGTVTNTEQRRQDTAFLTTQPSYVAGDRQLEYTEIYEKTLPSVASVSATTAYGKEAATGIVFSQDGLILTNYHAVAGSGSIRVQLYDDTSYTGQMLSYDELSDIAILKIPAEGLVPADFGSSENLQVGQEVAAIGDPLGSALRGSMTNGIISALNRELAVNGAAMTLIQTNTPLNEGNSGGPLLDRYGKVIGMNIAKVDALSKTGAVEGIGFAIPIDTVLSVARELLKQGYVSGRAWLPLQVADMDELQRLYLDLPRGAFITEIDTASEVYAGGLRYGDILVSIANMQITSAADYTRALTSLSPGDTVELIFYRNGSYGKLSVQLLEQTNGTEQ